MEMWRVVSKCQSSPHTKMKVTVWTWQKENNIIKKMQGYSKVEKPPSHTREIPIRSDEFPAVHDTKKSNANSCQNGTWQPVNVWIVSNTRRTCVWGLKKDWGAFYVAHTAMGTWNVVGTSIPKCFMRWRENKWEEEKVIKKKQNNKRRNEHSKTQSDQKNKKKDLDKKWNEMPFK